MVFVTSKSDLWFSVKWWTFTNVNIILPFKRAKYRRVWCYFNKLVFYKISQSQFQNKKITNHFQDNVKYFDSRVFKKKKNFVFRKFPSSLLLGRLNKILWGNVILEPKTYQKKTLKYIKVHPFCILGLKIIFTGDIKIPWY